MGCPGPRSAAPWAGRSEVGQGDASFKNTWAISKLDVAWVGLIADEQSALGQVPKRAEEARTWVVSRSAGKKQAP